MEDGEDGPVCVAFAPIVTVRFGRSRGTKVF